MTASKRQKTLTAAVLLGTLAPLVAVTGDADVVPVVLLGATVDVFKVVGFTLVGFLVGYVFHTAFLEEGE